MIGEDAALWVEVGRWGRVGGGLWVYLHWVLSLPQAPSPGGRPQLPTSPTDGWGPGL